MKIAIQIDDLLCKTTEKLESAGVIYSDDPKSLKDEMLWAKMEAYDDVPELKDLVNRWAVDEYIPIETFFLTDRPKSLFLITRNWLRRQGFEFKDHQLIMNSIYRYDCVLNQVSYCIQSPSDWTPWYRYTRLERRGTMAIAVDRSLDKGSWVEDGDYFTTTSLPRAFDLAICAETM